MTQTELNEAGPHLLERAIFEGILKGRRPRIGVRVFVIVVGESATRQNRQWKAADEENPQRTKITIRTTSRIGAFRVSSTTGTANRDRQVNVLESLLDARITTSD